MVKESSDEVRFDFKLSQNEIDKMMIKYYEDIDDIISSFLIVSSNQTFTDNDVEKLFNDYINPLNQLYYYKTNENNFITLSCLKEYIKENKKWI